MASPQEARQRLADLMEDRRADLRLRWEDVAQAGGISVKVLHDVRNGTSKPRRNTLRGIDAGLQWVPGSAERVLKDGDPEPLSEPPGSGPVPASEGELIRRAREALPMDIPAAARLMAEHCAPGEAIAADEWRAIERGTPVADDVLAAMSATTATEPEGLEAVGRTKAATLLREIRSRALGASQDGQDPDLAEMVAEWPSMSAEQRMAVKGVFNLVTGRTVPPAARQQDTRRYGT